MSKPGSILDYALEAAEQGLRVHPLKPLDKRPLLKNWPEQATTDPVTIMQWFRDTPNANYGVATGSGSDCVVIDLDGSDAQSFWTARALPRGNKVITPSGPDRNHLYFRIEGAEVQTNQGRHNGIHPNIDVRGEGGYVVGPGSMLPSGTYQGRLLNIPMIPAEVLELLPEKQTYVSVPRDGDKVESASASEMQQIDAGIRLLAELPRVWHEGAGWRSTFYRVACWFSRMVNSPDYALTEAGAWQILMANAPTDSEWGEPEAHEQWLSARRSTEGQFAEVPRDKMPSLLRFADAANSLPQFTSTGIPFLGSDGLLFAGFEPGGDWQVRQRIMRECFAAGMSDDEVGTIVWGSAAGYEVQTDRDGLPRLWKEVSLARAQFEGAGGADGAAAADAAADLDVVQSSSSAGEGPKRIPLLTDEERQSVYDSGWWGEQYLEWAKETVPVFNAPYHRMSRWTALSAIFSDRIFLPGQGRRIYCNLYSIKLGESSTGKTESDLLSEMVIKFSREEDDQPMIGGNASANALIKKLIERDGRTTMFSRDEAHDLVAASKSQSWLGDLFGVITDVHGGKVPMVLRNGAQDISGVQATSFMVMNLTGIERIMAENLDDSHWRSGFLPRCVWSIGESMWDVEDPEIVEPEGDAEFTYEAMPRSWGRTFSSIRDLQLSSATGDLVPLRASAEALKRLMEARAKLKAHMRKVSRYEDLRPTIIRFWVNIRVCAALAAASRGATCVTLADMLIALEQAEEWAGNFVYMASQTAATQFTRDVAKLEQFIAAQRDGQVRIERVYSFFGRDGLAKPQVDMYIQQLVSEGRITRGARPGSNSKAVFLMIARKEGVAA